MARPNGEGSDIAARRRRGTAGDVRGSAARRARRCHIDIAARRSPHLAETSPRESRGEPHHTAKPRGASSFDCRVPQWRTVLHISLSPWRAALSHSRVLLWCELRFAWYDVFDDTKRTIFIEEKNIKERRMEWWYPDHLEKQNGLVVSRPSRKRMMDLLQT